MPISMFSQWSWCSLLSVLSVGMFPEGEKGGKEPCSVSILFQTLSVLVVCSPVDTNRSSGICSSHVFSCIFLLS